MKRFCLYIIMLSVVQWVAGQSNRSKASDETDKLIADIFEEYTAATDENIDYETFYNDLIELTENPLNLNSVTKEELEKLPFLTALQIESILFYVYRFGPMHTIYELQLVDGLDMTDIRRMLPFVSVTDMGIQQEKLNLRKILRYGRNETYIRFDAGLEKKQGYSPDDSGEKAYSGSPYYNSVKYKFHYRDRVAAGFTMEKDAGEPFPGKSGYDFYSLHMQLNRVGQFKTIVLGDYKASFGQGLVFGSGFGSGKSSYVMNAASRSTGLKKFSSTDEVNYLRGAGATLKLKGVEVTAFYSGKYIDADTVSGTFTSVYRTGLHRTESEIDKKHTVTQQVGGLNVSYYYKNIQIGFTSAYTSLNHRLEPDSALYNFNYFRGDKQLNIGVNYRLRWQKFLFFGETAWAGSKALATLNGCMFSPLTRVSLLALFRHYSPEYDTFFAYAFAEGSRVNNETGMYLAAEVRPYKNWRISAYADNYRSRWPRYGIDVPSYGKDYLILLEYTPRRNLSMLWRIKTEKKLQNLSESTTPLATIIADEKSAARYQLTYSFGNFSFRNVIDGNMARQGDQPYTYGFMALQDMSYDFKKLPLSIDLRYLFFDAKAYDNRLYTYEKDVLYAFSIPALYGTGGRYYLNVRYEISKQLTLWFKIAQTVYTDDRETVGSGNDERKGNRSTDLRFLVKWEF